MKCQYFKLVFAAIILVVVNISCSTSETRDGKRTVLFDEEWKFIKADIQGAENPVFDDESWRTIDLPHDWSIEDLPNQSSDSIIGPFSKASIGKMGTGYTVGGTAWYRKTFVLNKSDKNKKAFIQFDGIYMLSDVWINGHHLGKNTNGYTSFYYELTPYLKPAGQPNVLAVKVQNEGINARWYSGAGIYRHTWLTLVDPVYIDIWGVCIKTPDVSAREAQVNVNATLVNSTKEDVDLIVETIISSVPGNVVSESKNEITIAAGTNFDFDKVVAISNPKLWSPDEPNLYQAEIVLWNADKKVDELKTNFGVRKISFDAENGFMLNDKKLLLKGGCFHHDNGPLGAAAIDRAEERKMQLLKSVGYNAIRCSHNPPSPYLLEVCDRLGILVIDEIYDMWEASKLASLAQMLGGGSSQSQNINDLSVYFQENWEQDLENWILRDRNHPSVIMWSIGNEIPEAGDTSGLRIATKLAEKVRSLDNTRAVTEALVDMMAMVTGHSNWENYAPHMAQLDVLGYNYGFQKYENEHKDYPERIYYASEFMPPLSLENWNKAEELPYVIGNFSWTAIDYLGEAGTGTPRYLPADSPLLNAAGGTSMSAMMTFFDTNSWPTVVNFQGDLDLIGNRKAASFYQSVVWRDSDVELLVHSPVPEGMAEITSPWGFPNEWKCWTWPGSDGKELEVHVYTRSELVKLELNGKVIGEQTVDGTDLITASFRVPYEPGALVARCYDNGIETASQTLVTAGEPAAIKLQADRDMIKADKNDLAYISVDIVDTDGNIVPSAEGITIKFEIEGPGDIAGVGNGNPSEPASFQQPVCTTFHGKCLVIIQPQVSPGNVILTAKSEGLQTAAIEVRVN